MKTILLVLFLTCIGSMAQTPPAPAEPPAPAPGATDIKDERLRQALRQALEARTNAAAAARSPAAVMTNKPAAPALPVPAPATPAVSSAAPTLAAPSPAIAAPAVPEPAAPAAPAPASGPSIVAPASTNESLVAITPPPPAANTPPEEMLPAGTINFPATDLNQVLQIYAELVNRTVLRPTTLPAPTITLKTQTPLTKKEAMQAFDAVLALNGIAMIPIGDKFVKAVPVAQAGQEGAAWNKLPADQLPDVGQYLTHVVQLKYTKPSEMVQVLQPFAKIPNAILPIDSSAIVVLRDNTENVKRMLEMIKQVDIAVPSEFISEVIPIKYALASDISSALNALSSGGGGATVGSTGGGATGRSMTGSRAGYRGTTGTFPGQTTPGMTSPFGTSPLGTTTPGAAGATGSFTDRLQNIIRRAANVTGEITVLGQTKIIADERTNSLLIFASREDMKMIKDIVSKLDVVLAQVLIEAVIVEVSLDDSKSLGVSYLQRPVSDASGNNLGVGAINNKTFLQQSDFVTGLTTNAGSGFLPGGFSYLAHLGGDLDIAVNALATGTKARILQRPRIQTSHAVPATLFVGESRPYPTSSYYGGGAYGGYSSIQQLQIGVTLEVTPLINPDGLVVMDIHQKIDSFKGNVTIQNVGDVPITSSKDATAKVAVRDHDTIMLGGLIDDQKTSNNSGVPFLKDIPLLGYLFRSSSADNIRGELIVLIRPTVLPTPEVAALAATAEKNKMPEVRRAESEVQKAEEKRLREVEKEFGPLN